MDAYQVSYIKGNDVTTSGATYPETELDAWVDAARLQSQGYTTKIYIYRDGKGMLAPN